MIDADPDIDAVGCDGELFYDPDDGTPPPKSYFASIGRRSVPDPSRAVTLGEFLDEGVPLYIGAFRREVWDAHRGFDPATTDVEPDVALWLSAAAAGDHIRVLPDRLARMRLRPDSASRHPTRIDDFQVRLLRSFQLALAQQPHSHNGSPESRALRGLRYEHNLRRARCSLLAGDVSTARSAARDAYRERHTLRAAVVVAALHISPDTLRRVHPVKNTAPAHHRSRAMAHQQGRRAMTPTGSDVAPEGGLGSVLKRGAAISALATVLAQIITVVQTLVLGRLLGPYEIGVFTAGSVLVSGLVVVAQGSLGHAVIQRERDLEDAANTALVVTFVTGLVLALGLAAASPLIGIVFHDPRVGLIAMACSGLALLHACTTVPDALMQRAFMFRRRIVIDPTVSLIFAVVAITFAAWATAPGRW